MLTLPAEVVPWLRPLPCRIPCLPPSAPRAAAPQGKTLQGISLLWTLLSAKGHPLLGGDPVARRVVICCPTSLVG